MRLGAPSRRQEVRNSSGDKPQLTKDYRDVGLELRQSRGVPDWLGNREQRGKAGFDRCSLPYADRRAETTVKTPRVFGENVGCLHVKVLCFFVVFEALHEHVGLGQPCVARPRGLPRRFEQVDGLIELLNARTEMAGVTHRHGDVVVVGCRPGGICRAIGSALRSFKPPQGTFMVGVVMGHQSQKAVQPAPIFSRGAPQVLEATGDKRGAFRLGSGKKIFRKEDEREDAGLLGEHDGKPSAAREAEQIGQCEQGLDAWESSRLYLREIVRRYSDLCGSLRNTEGHIRRSSNCKPWTIEYHKFLAEYRSRAADAEREIEEMQRALRAEADLSQAEETLASLGLRLQRAAMEGEIPFDVKQSLVRELVEKVVVTDAAIEIRGAFEAVAQPSEDFMPLIVHMEKRAVTKITERVGKTAAR